MSLVVDASVAVKWLVAEKDSDVADRLLAGNEELYAPRLMVSEVANALWCKARVGQLEPGQAGLLMAAVSEAPLRWFADETVCADAVRLAVTLDRPVYDCVYLAVAHRVNAQMVTADARFANSLAATEHSGAVIMLADYGKDNITGG